MNEKELYHFMRDYECGVCFNKSEKEIQAWVHVPYDELTEFIEIVNPKYESYPKAELQENSACILIHDLVEDLDEFEKCFPHEDWINAKDRYMEYKNLAGDKL